MEDEFLKCPPAPDPQVQEFLTGEAPKASDGLEDDPPQTATPDPSPKRHNEWIHWHM